MYSIKQLATLADISVRTLHYYDEIGLLHPSIVKENGYRQYDDAALLRLQQILFYREMGMALTQIKDVLDAPDFDLLTALREHRATLQAKITRLEHLVSTVDSTIMHVVGEVKMSKKKNLFKGFSKEKQKEYERKARLMYDPVTVNQSIKLWNSYSKDEKKDIQKEGGKIYLDLVEAMKSGAKAGSAEVTAILDRWQAHLHYFYEPNLEILRGLGALYHDDAEFNATFTNFHPDLPAYLKETITVYVDELETAALEQMMSADESNRLEG